MTSYVMTLATPDNTGASRMACQFGRALAKRGHRVVVAHGPIPRDAQGTPAESVLPAMHEAGIETHLEPRLAFPLSPRLSRDVANLAGRVGAEAIVGVNQRDRAVALQAAGRAGIAGLISAQNQHRFWGPRPIAWMKEKFYASVVRRHARLVVCTSKVVQDEFVTRFGLPISKTVTLQNAIQVANFPEYSAVAIDNVRQSLGIDESTFMWLNVGRVDYQKGQDILIEALGHLRTTAQPWKIVVVGDVSAGPNQPRMQKYARQFRERADALGLSDRIVFAGWRSDVPLLLRATNGYVHAARWEGSPLAVIEAMAASCPIVTPDNAARPAGFEPGRHGLLAKAEDPISLAHRMAHMMALPVQERSAFGTAARQLAEADFDIAHVGSRFADLVEAHSGLGGGRN